MNRCHLPGIRKNLLSVIAGIVIAACGSTHGSSDVAGGAPLCAPPSGCAPPDPATTQLGSPIVSFAADVVPIFQGSCALSSACHNAQGAAGPSGLYLGRPADMLADPSGIFQATVNVKSMELPSMSYVAPGDVDDSYLMHKMDGDMCQFTTCSSSPVAGCGVVMPLSGCALPAAERDTIRRWIAQGALNN